MIGENLRRARKAAGLTQRKLAQQAGVSPSHISLIESGKSEVSDLALAAIASVLGTTPQELRGIEPPTDGRKLTTITGELNPEETQVVLALRRLKKADQRAVIAHALGLDLLALQAQAAEEASRPVELTPYIPARPERQGSMVLVPMIGYVAAGDPWPGDEPLPDEVEVPGALYTPGCAVVTVRGHSLVLDGVLDGDRLLIEAADHDYRKGDLVVASVDLDGTPGMVVKRFGGQRQGTITLQSAHPAHPDIQGEAKSEIQIRALVRHVWRSS